MPNRERLEVPALTGVLCLAAATFSWRLGTSSLFIDESFSWHAAAGSLPAVFATVHATEVAPPAYYLLLHVWIALFGSGSEWGMRLLSVLGGIVLVAAVAWLGGLLGGRWVRVLSGLSAALSPLALQYAQELRAYVFAMLCATVAVAAALRAVRGPGRSDLGLAPSGHGSAPAGRWLLLAGAASVATLWLHYTGLLVIAPLAIFIARASVLDRRLRAAYVTVCGLAQVAVIPLMVHQLGAGHQGGVAPFATPTATNFLRVLGTPFDGRFATHALTYLTGAAVVVLAAAWMWRRPAWRLLVILAATPVLAVILITLVAELAARHSDYALITRYTAVAAPFMLVLVAGAVASLPRAAGLALAALAALAAITGLTYSYSTVWPNLRGAFATVARGRGPDVGGAVVLAGYPAQPGASSYYLRRVAGLPVVRLRARGGLAPPASLQRLWLVSDLGAQPGAMQRLRAAGWREVSNSVFHPGIELTVLSRR